MILNYLVKQHGRVNVNRATVDDLVEVLGVTPETADDHREVPQGARELRDYDGFAKVPGLDLEKLEKKRDAISF